MKFANRCILPVLLGLVLLLSGFGCSANARKARRLETANQHLKAGAYDAAEIEYLNVLKIDRLNPDAIARLGIIYSEQGRIGRSFAYLTKARELQPENLEVRSRLAKLHAATGRFKDAHAEALYVLQKRPNDEEAPVLLAETSLDAAEVEDTKRRLNALPPNLAGTAPVLAGLGAIELRQRNSAAAQRLFERAVAADPKSGPAQIAMAAMAMAQNKPEEADKAYAAAVANAPVRSIRRMQYARFKIQQGQTEAAKVQLEEITQKASDYIPAWLLLAEIYLGQQKHDDALAALAKITSRDSHHPEAMLLSGRVRLAKGEVDKAVSELEVAASTFAQSPAHHHLLGVAYTTKGELPKAIGSLTHAVSLAPNFAPAVIALAELNLRQGNAAATITALRGLLQKQPQLLEARLLLANAYRTSGNFEEALVAYRQLEQAFPKEPQAPLQIGLVLVQLGKSAEARQSFERALQLMPDFLEALEQVINIDLRERKFTAARDRINAYAALNPNSGGPYLLLSKTYLAQGDVTNGESMLQKSISVQPDQIAAYFQLARLYLATKQHEKAMANLQQAVKNDPKNPEPPMMLGVLHEEQENFPAARENYEKVLALNSRSSSALNNLAYLYSERFNEPDKAFEMAQRSRELLPGVPQAADTLGWVLHKRGQYSWALSLLMESAEKLPTSPDVQYHLGMTHYMLGEEQAAKAALERALKLGDSFAGAEQARKALSILAIEPTSDASAVMTLEQHVANRPDPIAFVRLGALHEKRNDLAKASQAYEAALKVSANNVRAMMGLIRLHRARSETQKALELTKSARKLAPSDPDVAQVLGDLALETGDHGWATSLLHEVVRAKPEDAEAQILYGQAAYHMGQVDSAVEALRRGLEMSPASKSASQAREFVNLIALSKDGAKATAAAAEIDTILKKTPKHASALMALAASKEHQRDATAAIQTYERILGHYADLSPARRQLAILLAENRPADPKALETANKARELFPNDPHVAKAAGIVLFQQGNHNRAASLLEESSRTRSDDPEVFYYLGMAQAQLKNPSASARSLNRALELNLKPDLAAKARESLAKAK